MSSGLIPGVSVNRWQAVFLCVVESYGAALISSNISPELVNRLGRGIFLCPSLGLLEASMRPFFMGECRYTGQKKCRQRALKWQIEGVKL
nr:MAG TPA: hypothetical protein [Caudoviricetes sp.]